jgi:tetratricopeptide (TPR) repeat protein
MNVILYCHLINLYLDLNKLNEGFTILRKARLIEKDNSVLHYLEGSLFLKRGDNLLKTKKFDSAITNYKKALKKYQEVAKKEDSLSKDAKKAIKTVEMKIKKAKEKKWWAKD